MDNVLPSLGLCCIQREPHLPLITINTPVCKRVCTLLPYDETLVSSVPADWGLVKGWNQRERESHTKTKKSQVTCVAQ